MGYARRRRPGAGVRAPARAAAESDRVVRRAAAGPVAACCRLLAGDRSARSRTSAPPRRSAARGSRARWWARPSPPRAGRPRADLPQLRRRRLGVGLLRRLGFEPIGLVHNFHCPAVHAASAPGWTFRRRGSSDRHRYRQATERYGRQGSAIVGQLVGIGELVAARRRSSPRGGCPGRRRPGRPAAGGGRSGTCRAVQAPMPLTATSSAVTSSSASR